MKVGIIGAGKLGCSLALAFKNKGFLISGIYSRTQEAVESLNRQLGMNFENNLLQTVKNSEIIFVTVNDTELEKVANMISAGIGQSDIHGKTFFHCSGAVSSEVFEDIKRLGGYTASLHPIQTFADKTEGWKGLNNIYFGFEGCLEASCTAKEIMQALSSNMIIIEKENKPLYHAAASILSNYTVTLSYITENLLSKIGIAPDVGIKAFLPLLENTVSNIEKFGSINSLTGPISRGDSKVIEGHLKSMKKKSPETIEIYKALGRATVEAALKKGSIDKEIANKLYTTIDNEG